MTLIEVSDSINSLPDVAKRLIGAFPSIFTDDVTSALRAVPSTYERARMVHDPGKAPFFPHRASLSPDSISLTLCEQGVQIPSRIYVAEPTATAMLSLTHHQRAIVAGLYTRHYDGRVREKSLGNLLSSNPDWAPPFVLMLVGEYVDEIIKVILSRVDAMRDDRYLKFVADNPAFMRRLQKQVVSYWSYDSGYRRFSDYPGYKVLQQLGWWSGPEGRKLLKRDRRSKSQR